ncbi:uncharacterized protein BXZ73DRAFT_52492 [Epithele typhae]|uniref:uncharacterized protein n=1 Tax=Epithele typhae TaxID=378194 RepID=UPI002007B8A1|nr:uncharacterized protein BXZ73DRAFT_52492 [Epithele typhae]KAH9919476.1 hypothetical protein BXZ73DRAFT_52492 [Epithele typhae]
MADLNPLELALVNKLLPILVKIRYAELASTMIILFDHVLTLDQEIRLVWNAQRSLGKALFLLNRYYALVIVLFNNYVLFNTNVLTSSVSGCTCSSHACLLWFRWQGVTGVLMFIIAEFILQLRLYALYLGNKRVVAVSTFISLAAAASSAYVVGRALSLTTDSCDSLAVRLPLGASTVCVPFGLPDDFYAFWIPMLISECVLCGLALYRGLQRYRTDGALILSGRGIIEILVRDSVYYFLILFATYLMNAIIFLTRPDSEFEIPIGFAVALSVVMSNRLCLNVRGYIIEESEGPMSLYTNPPRPSAFVSLSGAVDNNQSTSFVHEGATLSAMEMHSLRQLRAGSWKHAHGFTHEREDGFCDAVVIK